MSNPTRFYRITRYGEIWRVLDLSRSIFNPFAYSGMRKGGNVQALLKLIIRANKFEPFHLEVEP